MTNIDPRTGLFKAPRFHTFYLNRPRQYGKRQELSLRFLGLFPIRKYTMNSEFTKEDLLSASEYILLNYNYEKDQRKNNKPDKKRGIIQLEDYIDLPALVGNDRWVYNKDTQRIEIVGRRGKMLAYSTALWYEDIHAILGSDDTFFELFPDVVALNHNPCDPDEVINAVLLSYGISVDSFGVCGKFVGGGYKFKVRNSPHISNYVISCKGIERYIGKYDFSNESELRDKIREETEDILTKLKPYEEQRKLSGYYPPKSII